MRLELPSGAWAELRPASGITERQRRPIRVAMAKFSAGARQAMAELGEDASPDLFTAADQELMYEINDLVAAALIDTASFVPAGQRCSADHVADLAAVDYDAVVESVSPHIGAVMTGIDFSPTPDRESPTHPSSE